MIEIEMSKDIHDYEPRVVGMFTVRQIVCLCISAAYAVPLFMILGWFGLSMTTRATIAILLAAPGIACGYVKLYGMPLEKFFVSCVLPQLLFPTKRKYVTENTLDYLTRDDKKEAPKKKLTRKQKKELQVIMKDLGMTE